MEFSKFEQRFMNHFNEMINGTTKLFEVEIDKDEFWNLYLDSFPAGTNEIYRTRREYDCSCCRHFIKSFGNVVVIKDNKVVTLWDMDADSTTFQPVVDALSAYIKSKPVTNVHICKEKSVGTKQNFETTEDGTVVKWNHFYLDIPLNFVDRNYRSVGDLQGDFKTTHDVFKRSLDEISIDSIETVLELIASNTLYKGAEWERVLKDFLKYKKDYSKLISEDDKNNFAWEQSIIVGNVVGRIRNHSMGTLLVDISNGTDLDVAVRKYEAIMAPSNYKRPKAIFTQKMLEDAKNTITGLGYMDSLTRRYATLDDITVNNILFSNKDAAKRIQGVTDVFDEMIGEVKISPKKFSRVEEINIDKFISDVIPTANGLELYFENKHINNLVSLIAPKNADSKTMFKWNNNFSWAYTGNITDSLMKERVKAAGGKVDGDLRFSIQWNDVDTGTDNNDLDAHCITPSCEIYFGHRRDPYTHGELDVDITHPYKNIAVENITWSNRKTMKPGVYKFFVHQFANRGGRNGFRAEIEFDGQIYSFDYNKEVRQDQRIKVAEVTLDTNGNFTIKELLPSNLSSKEIWGINTNQFIPVSVMCYSPNYWDEQNGIGNKHYFFMLKDCVNSESPNGFFNEFLKEDLIKHKRVFEALGSKMRVEDTEDQLSGIGFSSTLRNDVIVKVKGATERILKIKF